ncbi:hypothetical protein FSP39_020523 [Pinctada imbricata]|uniref:Uncharacterized protein n=1 Tax=Pinctada imbricata TaxID=66713 RepID=A0AA88XXH6_PINIB|nr:hypothetical protein FSP39_020523 [Pinctada imbricata]
MPIVNLAISSAAQKGYQKKCGVIYREFQKNMNVYLKHEQELRADLRKMRKEKMTNRQFSLYRSAGADLFSKADETRRLIMKHNLSTTSPLMEFFDFNPWGLDAIVDEDLIRPQTAPLEMEEEGEMKEEIRPQTAGVVPDQSFSSEHVNKNNQTLASSLENRFIEPHVAKVEHLLHSQSVHSTQLPVQDATRPETVLDHADEEEMDVDGEVDTNTERTRARKITINADKFGVLQKGTVDVKLKNKDGKFILKPVSMDYEPDSVESVFIAKDPSKERMALVRQSTCIHSPTVSSELKVNNRIAIQKSLMGKAAKKTSVSEIFKGARDRKTRHFRIFLKNPADSNEDENQGEDEKKQNNSNSTSQTISIYKHQKKMTSSNPNRSTSKVVPTIRTNSDSSDKGRSNEGQKLIAFKERAMGGKHNNISVSITTKPKENAQSPTTPTSQMNQPIGGILFKRRCDSSQSSIRPPSQLSIGNNDVFSTSGYHRVMFAKMPNTDQPDSRGPTPLNRSTSSMSMRDSNVQFAFSDADMTDMIQKLVEGGGTDGSLSDRPVSNLSVGGAMRTVQMMKKFSGILQRKRNTPTPSQLSSEFDTPFRPASRLRSSRDTRELIRNIKKRDEEYEEAMTSMRRRVALGASSGPRPSVVGHR